MRKRERTTTYVETVHGHPDVIRERLRQVRGEVRRANREIRLAAMDTGATPIQFFARARGRLGSNSPYAGLYRVGGSKYRSRCLDIDLDHCSHADIYIAARSRRRS